MDACPLTLPLSLVVDGLGPGVPGNLTFVAVTEGAVQVDVGATVLVPSGSLLATRTTPVLGPVGPGSRWISLSFSPKLLHDALGHLPPETLGETAAMDFWLVEPYWTTPIVITPSPPSFEAALRNMQEAGTMVEVRTSPYWRCFARSAVFDFLQGLRRVVEGGAARATDPPESDWVSSVLLFLHSQLAQNPTLAEAALQLGSNRAAFSRRIKEETGRTYHQLVSDLRLRKAEWLVRQTELPLGRIAEAVGVLDQTHFARLFRKQFSASPRDYRTAEKRRKAENL